MITRALTATVLIIIVLGGTFVYGAIHTITEETWPDW